MIAVSVVICTYDRPDLFRATLRSCLLDATRTGLPYEVVVADNSLAGHATAIIDELQPTAPDVPVRRVPVSPPNISLARNGGLRAAAAPLVAFLDDDLEVVPGWLDALVATLTKTGADVAVGPVRPRFPDGTPPPWDPNGGRFTRLLDWPTGRPIVASGPDKPADFALSTASSIWRAATCFTDPAPFDPAFGACGGEDYDLFLRLERRGRTFVWCNEAGVTETVPANRMALSYHVLRAYSGGQVFAAAMIKNAARPTRQIAYVVLAGLAQACVFGLATPALAAASVATDKLSGKRQDVRFRLRAALGKLTWWRRVGLYHVEAQRAAARR